MSLVNPARPVISRTDITTADNNRVPNSNSNISAERPPQLFDTTGFRFPGLFLPSRSVMMAGATEDIQTLVSLARAQIKEQAYSDAKHSLEVALEKLGPGGDTFPFQGLVAFLVSKARGDVTHTPVRASYYLGLARFVALKIGADTTEIDQLMSTIPAEHRREIVAEAPETGPTRSSAEVSREFKDVYDQGAPYSRLSALARQYAEAVQRESGGFDIGFEQLEFDVSRGVADIVSHATTRPDNYYVFFCNPVDVDRVKSLIGKALVAGSTFGRGIKVVADGQIERAGTVRVFAGGDDILAIARYDQIHHGAPPIAAAPGTPARPKSGPTERRTPTSETYRDYYKRTFTVPRTASSTAISRQLQSYIDAAMGEPGHYFAIVAGHEVIGQTQAAFRQIISRYSTSRNRQTKAAAERVASRMQFVRDGSMSCDGGRCSIMFVGATSPRRLGEVVSTSSGSSRREIRVIDEGEGSPRRGSDDDVIRLPYPEDDEETRPPRYE